uniref:Ig-like domain-containing protein n=1 Tax=Rhodnius prolixus TaxID=13249 RepID=T1HC90_RHOPR
MEFGRLYLFDNSGEKSPTPPQYVLWYHNSKMINYDTSRGGVQVRTEQGQKTESHLTIHDSKYSDSGNYTCSASNTQPAYIHVFVSEGNVYIRFRMVLCSTNQRLETMISFSSLVSKLRRIYFGRICFVGKHLQDVANFQWKIDYGYSLPMLG